MNLASELGDARRLAVAFATITLAFVALLASSERAGAAETIFWNNYGAVEDADFVSYADLAGGSGGVLNLSPAAKLNSPEGMAYDTVTNQLFVGSEVDPKGEIVAINVDGSGSARFTAPGAVIAGPEGVAVDPVRRTIYWVNTDGTGSIGWAKLDGSVGGVLNTAGATMDGPYRIALDPVSGRVYWANAGPTPESISWASVDNTGGGDLAIAGPFVPDGITGLSVDPAGGRIFWLANDSDAIGYASLAGGSGNEVNLSGAPIKDPFGLAFDPGLQRLYWANYNNNTEVAADALGFANLAGGGGGITPLTAAVDGPQDPVVIKSPVGTSAPTVVRNAKSRGELTCSTGGWGADFPGSFVYQAPRSFAYQWNRNGTAIGGATAATFTATSPGSYACTVTATNQAGSAGQQSDAIVVKGAKLELTTKRKAKADPGDLVTFKVKVVNQGDLRSGKARICVKLPKAAKDDLRKPKCRKVVKLKGHEKRVAKLRIKVKPGADRGTDKLTFQVKGAPGKAAKSKIVVR